jgi:hypothetical protein
MSEQQGVAEANSSTLPEPEVKPEPAPIEKDEKLRTSPIVVESDPNPEVRAKAV